VRLSHQFQPHIFFSFSFSLSLSPPPNRYILTAARLITPQLDKKDWSLGFQWAIDTLKPDHESIASELEIDMALMHLKRREFDKAIEMLKMFEKKDQHHRAMAATNLSFIYFLEQDFNQVSPKKKKNSS
jgi:intraflagellar transport protein 88